MSGIDLSDLFVKPVPGKPDVFAFTFDFIPTGKALEGGETASVVSEADNGDLIIEGYAAVFDGVDRQDENFAGGSFEHGIKAFLGGQAGLCFHHKHDKLLGKVLELEQDSKGLKMKARVDAAIRSHPELGTIYEQIKRGSLNALSVGGFFKRDNVRKKITGVDFTEISVTPVPVHPGTRFAVVAGKALLDDVDVPEKPNVGEVRESDVEQVKWLTTELGRLFDSIESAASKRQKTTI